MVQVSVIIPVYNVEQYLERCVNSVLNQSFSEIEIILVDDGSTDRSGEICDEFSRKDDRVLVIHQNNRGLSSARNTGIEKARGKYVSFVDSDDWIEINMIKKLYELSIQNDADISECGYVKAYEEAKITEIKEKTKEFIGEDKLLALYSSECYGTITVWNKLYKKELFKKILFMENRLFEDQIITPQLFYIANKIISTNYVGYFYYQRNDSITNSRFTLKKLEALEAYRLTRTFLKEKKMWNVLEYHDSTYAFLLLKYIKLVKKSNLSDEQYNMLKKEFDCLLLHFLNNKVLLFKSKILMLWRRIWL